MKFVKKPAKNIKAKPKTSDSCRVFYPILAPTEL